MKKSALIFAICLSGFTLPCAGAQDASSPASFPRLSRRSDLPKSHVGLFGGAQSQRDDRRFGIAFNLGTAAVLGFSADYYVDPQLDLEAGIGMGQYLAVKYHPFGDRNWWSWSPYVGVAGVHVADSFSPLFRFFSDDRDTDHYFGVYLPIGVHFIAEGGFSFNVEVAFAGLWPAEKQNLLDPLYGPFGGIRLGYHFF